MNFFGLPKKKTLFIQFYSSVTQSNALSIFFIFDPQRERDLVNSVPFVCPLVPSIVIESYKII